MFSLQSERPFWPWLIFYGLMAVVIFGSPAILDDKKHAVDLSQAPWGWFAAMSAVILLGFCVSVEVYDWRQWDAEERRAFWRDFWIAVCVVAISVAGAVMLAGLFGWPYTMVSNIAFIPLAIWGVWRYFRRRDREVWD